MMNPGTAETATINLPAGASWRGIGSPAGSRGYKYTDVDAANGPCKVVLVKPGKLIKAVCSAGTAPIAYSLDESTQASLTLSVQLGAAALQCANFGGTISKNQGTSNPGPIGIFRAKDAPALETRAPRRREGDTKFTKEGPSRPDV